MVMAGIIVAVIVAGVLVYWFVFHWDAPPKRWCVMLYLTSNTPASVAAVSRPDSETGVPADAPEVPTLDEKLDQVVNNVIRQLPCATSDGISANPGWDDVYVVYRAIWDDPKRAPEARVVRPEISAPTKTYFDGETIWDVGYAIDFSKDIELFFEWAYDNCPATQYAVFFWGHAMGPAGFLQPSEPPVVVSPLLALLGKVVFVLTGTRWSGSLDVASVGNAIGSIVQERFRKGDFGNGDDSPNLEATPTIPVTSGSGGNAGSGAAPIVFVAGQVVPKVDVVLFQDCWMSTLETAFQMQDNVRYIVSSQSLVPVGFAPGNQLGAVWPYKDLIDVFLTQSNFAAPMMTTLENFFNGAGRPAGAPQDYNRYPATKVLFSLMDCGTTAQFVSLAMQTEYLTLVTALYPLGPDGRSKLIELSYGAAGRIFELSGVDLIAGDEALIDILTFCGFLQAPTRWPAGLGLTSLQQTAITGAAAALQPKVATLVTNTFQSPPIAAGDPVYRGVAALYKPFAVFGNDPYIMAAFRTSYENLQFSKRTLAPLPVGGTTECSWTQYAFDRYPW
jgi:hypothetical protein